MADRHGSADADKAAKISRLIRKLHETHEELRELTGDGVDTLLHPDGAIYMMPKAQADLTQSERIQRHFADERAAILDSLPASIALLDEDGTILAVNDRWREFAVTNDYPGDPDMIGENYISACRRAVGDDEEDAGTVAQAIRAVLEGSRDRFSTQYPCHSPRDRRWFAMTVTPVNSGARRGAVVMHFDITDRVLADERARLYKARLEQIVEQSNVGILVERDGKPLLVNPGLARMLGYEGPDVILAQGDTLMLFDPVEHERLSSYSVARLTGGAAPDIYRAIARTRDGTALTLEARAFVINWDEGDAICAMFTDLTKQIASEEKVRQSEKLQAVGQLTGGVAHDFNNLLTVVLGGTEVLSSELHDHPRLKSLAETIASAAERGAELTGRLLAFSRKQPLDPTVLDVGQLIRGIENLLRRTLPESIELEVIHFGGLWKIEVDPHQLESALLNLALNARDAMPDGGALTIEMSNVVLDDAYVAEELDVAAGQYVLVVVTDNGHGIPPESVSRIFEPFFTTKVSGAGTGLGLSMVYGFVKQSGGHVRVYSEVGQGTSLKLYFPRSWGKEKRVPVTSAAQSPSGGRETILVVEDDELVREHVVAQLGSLGYRVLSAPAGAEALKVIQSGSEIDLLFTDVVMPGGMSGRELSEAARSIRPHLKVLFTSGYTQNSIVHHGRLDQGVELLSKPYRRNELAAKLRKVLDLDDS